MYINKRIEKWQNYSGSVMVLIGMVHLFAVFFVFESSADPVSVEGIRSSVYMFIATGMAIIFAGCLILYHSNGALRLEKQSWYTLMFCGGFLFTLGCGAAVAMPGNPFSWILAVGALVQLLPFIWFGKHFQKNNTDMAHITSLGVLKDELEEADHIDVKLYEGKKDLQSFIASWLSYHPWWFSGLYAIRKVFVQCLGMKQEINKADKVMKADEISMIQGEMVGFFKVEKAQKGRFWIAAAEDRHLKGFVGIIVEKRPTGMNRYHLITIVHYRDWSGPIYFNVIRPFHHLVVHAMARHALTHLNSH